MMEAIFGLAAIAVSAPIAAALIVSAASRREDAHWSLGKPPASPLEAAARRIVAFDVDSIDWPRSKAQVEAEAARRAAMHEAVEAMADVGRR